MIGNHFRPFTKKMLNILFPGDNEQCHYPNNISLQSEHKDNYKSLRYDKIKDIFSRIKDHLKGQFNASDIKDFDFDGIDKTAQFYFPLKFILKRSGDIVLSLCFEISIEPDDRGFYYGIAIDFLSDTSSDKTIDKGVAGIIQKRKKDIKEIFEDQLWKDYVDDIPKHHVWVWWKRLPSKSEEPDFIKCDSNYKKLFDPQYYEIILGKIFREVDSNFVFIKNHGILEDLSDIES